MTHSSQPTTSASQGYPGYGPQWQGYDLHQGGYIGSQMFPPLQIPGERPSSPGAPRFPPGPRETPRVNRPTSLSCHPPPEPPFCPPTNRWLTSQPQDSSRLQNRRSQMSKRLQTCLHCRRYPMTIVMQKMKAMIHRSWAVQKANLQSAWSKLNSPWSNLLKRWGRQPRVCSTSGRKYAWLVFRRASIDPLFGGTTVWNIFKVDPGTGRWWLQTFGDIRELGAIRYSR